MIINPGLPTETEVSDGAELELLPPCEYCGGPWLRTCSLTHHMCTEAGIAAAEREGK